MADALPLSPVPDAAPSGPVEEPQTTEAGRRKARLAAAIAAAGGPLAVDTATAAAMVGLGRATWFRAAAAKKTPVPVRILGKVLYRVADLELWVSLGCPDRKTFEARKAAMNANGRPR